MAGNLVEATDADFDAVTKEKRMGAGRFHPWCGPCKMIAPVLDQIAAERDNLTIAKVNTDVNPVTPGRFGVRGIPYLVLFHNGQPVIKRPGLCPSLDLTSG